MRLEARNICFRYSDKMPYILKNLSISVDEGERVGIVAPSGYGKTTLVRLLAGYERPTAGQVLLDGKPLAAKGKLAVQMISQHPENAVNPRWKMKRVLEEAGQLDVLPEIGIEPQWLSRYPRELSGGELQRFCVARALCAETRFLIADEISTMLDAITQAQIWQFLLAQAQERSIGLVAVTHNPALAKRICTRILDLRQINGVEAMPDYTIGGF